MTQEKTDPISDYSLRRQFYKKLASIGSSIGPMNPDGDLTVRRGSAIKLVPYITKNAIIEKVAPLLIINKMWMLLPNVISTEHRDVRKSPKGDGSSMNLVKVRVELGFIDLETGYSEKAVYEGDAFTISGKGTTVALAFAQRDFITQVFGISQEKLTDDERRERMTILEEELPSAFSDDGQPNEALRHKARQMCERASFAKIKSVAHRHGYRFSSEKVDSMSEEDLLQIILTGTDILSPTPMKEELGSISRSEADGEQ